MREKTCIEIHILHVFMCEIITIFSIARFTHKFKEIEANKKLIKQL